MLCFASLKHTKTPSTATPRTPPKTAQPATPITETATETPQQPSPKTATAPNQRMTLEQHLYVLTQEIKAGAYPNGISVRAVMKRHRLGYQKSKALIEKLTEQQAA